VIGVVMVRMFVVVVGIVGVGRFVIMIGVVMVRMFVVVNFLGRAHHRIPHVEHGLGAIRLVGQRELTAVLGDQGRVEGRLVAACQGEPSESE
jgi:hypothetical protein